MVENGPDQGPADSAPRPARIDDESIDVAAAVWCDDKSDSADDGVTVERRQPFEGLRLEFVDCLVERRNPVVADEIRLDMVGGVLNRPVRVATAASPTSGVWMEMVAIAALGGEFTLDWST